MVLLIDRSFLVNRFLNASLPPTVFPRRESFLFFIARVFFVRIVDSVSKFRESVFKRFDGSEENFERILDF